MGVDSTSGKITGMPALSDVGTKIAKFQVSDGTNFVPVDAFIAVVQNAEPPVVHTISLTFKTNQFAQVLLTDPQYVTDTSGNKLTFQSSDTFPQWISLGSRGEVRANPGASNVGEYDFNFSVSNSVASAPGKFHVSVVGNPDGPAPTWDSEIYLMKATVGQQFSDTLMGKASVTGGGAITFGKKSGPDWLGVDSSGALLGTPPKAGTDLFRVTATSGGKTATASLVISSAAANNPPVIKPISFTLKERQIISDTLTKFIEDPSHGTLIFTLTEAQKPTWLQLDPSGKITLNGPTWRDIGTHSYNFQVANGALSANGAIQVIVNKDPQTPQWVMEQLSLSEPVGANFAADVSGKCVDPDGRPLTFSGIGAPSWITVSPAGVISGTPSQAGNTQFVVTASNADKTANVNVTIVATGGGTPPHWTVPAIAFDPATVGVSFSYDLSPCAKDDQGKPLTFKKSMGPPGYWLQAMD